METTIKKYRTFSYYPFNVIEAEVEVNGITAYINMEVRNGVQTSFDEKMITETFWSYNTPLTEIDDANDNYISLSTIEEESALKALINLWNKKPVFKDDETWTEV